MTYSIFRKKGDPDAFYHAYDDTMKLWPVPYEDLMISTRFGETHVVASGRQGAPVLVLFHGMAFSATVWYANVEPLARMFRVYAVDTLGDLGKSAVKSVLNARREAMEWVSDLLAGLKVSRATLMGHSMGGWLALNYAIAEPDRIDHLVLLAPAASFQRITWKFYVKVFPVVAFPSDKRIRKELAWFLSPDYRPDDKAKVLIRQFVVSGMNCLPKLFVVPNVFSVQELNTCTVPTLLMVGDREVIYDHQRLVAQAKVSVPNLETTVVSGAGHVIAIEDSDFVNERVMAFLTDTAVKLVQ